MAIFRNKHKIKILVGIGAAAAILGGFYLFYIRPPRTFPTNKVISVPNGAGLAQIANSLKEKQVIRSTFWFNNFVIAFKYEKKIVGGEYYFDRPLNVYDVARRLTRGDFGVAQIKTTIPEGSTVVEIAEIVKKNYLDFDTEQFIKLAKEKEGYLFPDTYYFGVNNVSPKKVLDTMFSTFEKKINQNTDLQLSLRQNNKTLSDVIKMASILEKEARDTETRQMIAGILWRRIELKMPLQVDVSFLYINGKTTKELTLKDLKNESPYNTYNHLGLPPTPINNPGLDSILAALSATTTKNLYFLSDNKGVMHYAETLDEHVVNKRRYLK